MNGGEQGFLILKHSWCTTQKTLLATAVTCTLSRSSDLQCIPSLSETMPPLPELEKVEPYLYRVQIPAALSLARVELEPIFPHPNLNHLQTLE